MPENSGGVLMTY